MNSLLHALSEGTSKNVNSPLTAEMTFKSNFPPADSFVVELQLTSYLWNKAREWNRFQWLAKWAEQMSTQWNEHSAV